VEEGWKEETQARKGSRKVGETVEKEGSEGEEASERDGETEESERETDYEDERRFS